MLHLLQSHQKQQQFKHELHRPAVTHQDVLCKEELLPLIISQLQSYNFVPLAQTVAEATNIPLVFQPSARLAQLCALGQRMGDLNDDPLITLMQHDQEDSKVGGLVTSKLDEGGVQENSSSNNQITLFPSPTSCYTKLHKSNMLTGTFGVDEQYIASGGPDLSVKSLDPSRFKQVPPTQDDCYHDDTLPHRNLMDHSYNHSRELSPTSHPTLVSESYADSASMDYQEEDYEAARMLKSLSSSYSNPSSIMNHHNRQYYGHQNHPTHHNQYEPSNINVRRRYADEWARRASPMVDDDGQFLGSASDDDEDGRNLSDWGSAEESGDELYGESDSKQRSAGLRSKPKNAAGQFISSKNANRGVDLLRTAASSSGLSERCDSSGSIITADSSPESMSLATVGNARDGIPRWVCPGCGKVYSIQSKRSWTNHMIACTGDVPPPVKKRKRRGT